MRRVYISRSDVARNRGTRGPWMQGSGSRHQGEEPHQDMPREDQEEMWKDAEGRKKVDEAAKRKGDVEMRRVGEEEAEDQGSPEDCDCEESSDSSSSSSPSSSSSSPRSENVDEPMGAVEEDSEVDVMDIFSRCQGLPSEEMSKRVKQKRPFCVVGCPPCTVFSVLQSAKQNKDFPEFERKYYKALGFLSFCAEIYLMHAHAGRFYFHEHQVAALSGRSTR